MKYQKGRVYLNGKRVKAWYGQYLVYRKDANGEEVRKQRNVRICLKSEAPKWKARKMLEEIILRETNGVGPTPTLPPDDSVTFRWFVEERYIPMRHGGWSPAYRQTNTYQLKHYLVSHFGDEPLRTLSTFAIQMWLNGMAEKGYSASSVRKCFANMRSVTHMARKQKFLAEDPAEDVTMPLTDPVEKPIMTREQILALLGAIEDVHDLCLMYIGIFCGTRASEAMGLQWKSWTGDALTPYGTAYEGHFYKGRLKTKASGAPIPVPEPVRPVIEAWKRIAPDTSAEALMFPTFGRGKRTGQAVPRDGGSFLNWRIRPIARKLGIPDRLITFQVMRRTLGTNLQHHGTLKDAQGALRHASITTTGDIYVQTVDESVARAVSSRTAAVLDGWTAPVERLGLKGRNIRAHEGKPQGQNAI
jgi:integrase